MADQIPEETPADVQLKTKVKKTEPRKRELKSAKRKGGVPNLKKKRKNTKKWWWIGTGTVIVLIIAIYFVPRIGTPRYGICKTFIELHDPYPGFIEYVQSEEYNGQVTIDYNRTDSFGQRTLNQMKCTFKSQGNIYELASVDLNGKANVYPLEDPAEVEKFNLGVPSLLKNQPSLILPKGLPDDIKKYK